MKIIFFGTPDFAVPSLKRLLDHPDLEVLGVVTQPDKRRGRGNQLSPSPVKAIALTKNLPIWQPPRIKKDAETLNQLQQIEADIFVVVAYGQILSQEILDMPRLGCINVHGSLLPHYRGAAPIQWCIYRGETQTGITTMLMDAGMDTGAMLLKATTEIGLFDHAQQLAETLSSLGADLLVETLEKFEEITPIPQDNAQATYAPLIRKEDYALDWSKSAIALHNQVRGFFPNCVTTFRGQPLKILATIPIHPDVFSQLSPELTLLESEWSKSASGDLGEVVSIIKRVGAIAKTGSGLLLLKEVQLAGKRPQSGWDFANGTRLSVGERLE